MRNTSTVAIRSVALRGFDAEIAGVRFYCIFHVMGEDFAPTATPRDLRSGAGQT